MAPVVIIPCGASKQPHPAPAGQLYTGRYFTLCLAYAKTLTSHDRIFILSGKHGLLDLDQPVAPYEQRIDKPGAVSPQAVATQATARGVASEPVVIALTGRAYSRVVTSVWPSARMPLRTLGGMGHQMQWLRTQLERTPS